MAQGGFAARYGSEFLMRERLEQVARRYEQAAAECEVAAQHLRTTARHFRDGDVPRGCAHSWARGVTWFNPVSRSEYGSARGPDLTRIEQNFHTLSRASGRLSFRESLISEVIDLFTRNSRLTPLKESHLS